MSQTQKRTRKQNTGIRALTTKAEFLGFTRAEWSWSLYDWANSSFATTVMAGFFQIFFKKYWSSGIDPQLTTARLGVVLSVSGFAIAALSPVFGAFTDLSGRKKQALFVTMLLASACVVGLGLLQEGDWLPAMYLYGLAMFLFTASINFYDSLLPFVAGGERTNRVSLLGYSMGYLGGGVLFLINVLMYLKPQWFGLADGVQAVKYSFFSVAIWWIVFSLPLMKNVEEVGAPFVAGALPEQIVASFRGAATAARDIWQIPTLRFFLLAYWLYIDGVYTVITMAVDYGMSIGLESSDLISALLVTQFVGFPATLAYTFLTKERGPKFGLYICIGIYMLTVILATQMKTGVHFLLLAGTIGLVQGGVQSLSRSLFVQMIPKEKSGEFFGFFNLVGKFASVIGPMVVGATVYLTQTPQYGMLGLLFLFGTGVILLTRVPNPDVH